MRAELTDRTLITGQRHLTAIMTESVELHHTQRPHRGRQLRPPRPHPIPVRPDAAPVYSPLSAAHRRIPPGRSTFECRNPTRRFSLATQEMKVDPATVGDPRGATEQAVTDLATPTGSILMTWGPQSAYERGRSGRKCARQSRES